MGVDAEAGPVVRIESGLIRGTRSIEGVVAYKGVPYAAPPVGELRWKPPQSAPGWRGVRPATEFGSACLQFPTPPESFYTVDQPWMSEDCLFLNIWVPVGAKNLPVMVWIHGGALIWGAGSDPWYDGARLARRDVVVVTFNYRLGVFGYFSHPELSAESPHGASGNYGTLDQIAVLQWVKRNIASVGGDPARVTVFGESAGALSVAHLMASPLATGLFQGAIAQSVYLPAMPELRSSRFGLASAEAVGAELGRLADAPTLAELRAMPAPVLQDASIGLYSRIGGTTAVVDHWVQPAQIFETFDRGRQATVPFIAGFNSGEQRALDAGTLPPFPADAAAYEDRVRLAYADLAPEFLRLYPANTVVDSSYAAVRDAYYGWAVEKLLRAHGRVCPTTWMYYFDHAYPPAAARGLGAFHASDILFTFGNIGPDAVLPPNWPSPCDSPADIAMADTLMDHWVAFARTGCPASEGHPAWPFFDPDRQAYLLFQDGEASSGQRPMAGMFELQDAYMTRLGVAGRSWTWENIGTAATPIDPLTRDRLSGVQ